MHQMQLLHQMILTMSNQLLIQLMDYLVRNGDKKCLTLPDSVGGHSNADDSKYQALLQKLLNDENKRRQVKKEQGTLRPGQYSSIFKMPDGRTPRGSLQYALYSIDLI